MGNSLLILLVSFGLFGASLFLWPKLKQEQVPAQDQSMFLVLAQTPLGSSIEFTDEKMKMAEAMISKHPEVKRYYAAVGGFGGGDVDTGIIFITLKDRKDRPIDSQSGRRLTQADLISSVREELNKISDFRAIVQDLSTRGFTPQRGFPVDFTVRGPDWDKLTEASQTLYQQMRQNPNFVDVDTDYKVGQPEIEVFPRRREAADRGVSIQEIGQTINAMMGGVRAGKFTEGGRRNDVRVRVEKPFRQQASDIQELFVRNDNGQRVSLKQLTDIHEKSILKSITRRDRERAIGITANLAEGKSQTEVFKVVEDLAKKNLPPGYRVVFGGASKTLGESFSGLYFALYLGIVVSYMVLASQYNSFIQPFIVLLALPFSISGACLGLFLFKNSLNIYSFIGLILLMGIAKKNSILLVDFTNQERRKGKNVTDALLEACPKRLRPILMTSFATIAAAIPPALALGPGSETRIPMSIVVMGGMIVSTIMSLFVVPAAYKLMSKFERAPKV